MYAEITKWRTILLIEKKIKIKNQLNLSVSSNYDKTIEITHAPSLSVSFIYLFLNQEKASIMKKLRGDGILVYALKYASRDVFIGEQAEAGMLLPPET